MRERSRDAGNEVRRREPLPGTADASTRQRRLEQLQRAFEEATALLERWLAPLEQQPLVERRPWAARRYWASRVAAACAPQPGRRTQ